VHPLGFFGKPIEDRRTSAETLSDLLRSGEVSIVGRLLLGTVNEAMAASAAKELTSGIKHGCTAPAVAGEPRAPTTVAASRPGDRHFLEDGLPVCTAQAPRLVDQNQRIALDQHYDLA
jgi:hypothetical protein